MSTPVWQPGECITFYQHHGFFVLQVKFDEHIKGKNHAKVEAKKSKTPDSRHSVEAQSSSQLQRSASASHSAQPRIPSALPLTSPSDLQAPIKDAEHRCNVCQVPCTSKVIKADFLNKFVWNQPKIMTGKFWGPPSGEEPCQEIEGAQPG